MDIAGGIVSEIKRSPYTSLAALACFLALPVVWVMKADAGETNSVRTEVAEVRAEMRREFATSQLEGVRRELFDIDLRIKTLEREGIAVDRLLYQRRDELQSQQRRLEAKLQALDATQ